MAGIQLICLFTGLALNWKLKSFYPRITELPWYGRYAARFAVLTTPLLVGYQFGTKSEREKLNAYLDGMHRRLITLGNDGNL